MRLRVVGPNTHRKQTTVNIYSVGWNQQGCKYSPVFREIAVELEKRLTVRFAKSIGKIDLLVNSSLFHRRPGSGHCGMNEDDILFCVKHKRFVEFINDFKRNISPLLYTGAADVNVVFVCKAGVNRSVAAAEVVFHVLVMAGHKCAIKHLGANTWIPKRTCTTCTGCTRSTDIKQDAFKSAYLKWGRIGN